MAWNAVLLTGLPTALHASGLSGVATVTSEYIYRGRAMSDGDAAVQFGLDYDFDNGLFAGTWASTIDLQSRAGERDTELDFYVGFNHATQGPLGFAATLVRYTYPGQSGPVSYDYNELLATATLYERYSIEYGYTNDFYGRDWTGRHWEVRGEWPVDNAWVVSAGAGHTDLSDFSVPKYLHWDLGATARFSRLIVDLRWFDDENVDNASGFQTAGSQLVISLSAAF